MASSTHAGDEAVGRVTEYVSATVGDQLFAVPILRVRDVFMPERMARVPLAPAEVLGVLNLRGRIVTMIDMRRRLGLPHRPIKAAALALHIDLAAESYGLVMDSVGEVLMLPDLSREANPANLDKLFASVSAGVHRLEDRLVVVLDVDRVLDIGTHRVAA